MRKNKKGILSVAIISALCLTGISSAFALDAGDKKAAVNSIREARVQGNVQENLPSKEEIRQYINEHSWTKSKTTFDTEPNQDNYEVGKISSESLNNTLNSMNCIRYIVGLPEVVLNDTYTELAQHAAFVNFLNKQLSHQPEKPEGCPDEIYEKGLQGASSSNIAYGYSSGSADMFALSTRILSAWMNDSDTNNIDRLGHRRWVINPTMSATGFGEAGDGHYVYTAMYSFDRKNQFAVNDFISWPAKTMPVEYFEQDMAWSVELGSNYGKSVLSNVEVTLKKKGSNQTWTFNQATSNEQENYFNVDTQNYGSLANCIIFRPNLAEISYANGDIFEVSITGLTNSDGTPATLEYTVNFFSLEASEEESKEETTTEDTTEPSEETSTEEESKEETTTEDTTEPSEETSTEEESKEETTTEDTTEPSEETSTEEESKEETTTEDTTEPSEETSTEEESKEESTTEDTTEPSEETSTEEESKEESTTEDTTEPSEETSTEEESTTIPANNNNIGTSNSASFVVSIADAVKIQDSAIISGLEAAGLPNVTNLKVSVIPESDSIYQTVVDLIKNTEKIKDKNSVAIADLSLINTEGIIVKQQLNRKIKITLELFENIKNAKWVETFRYNETTKTFDSLGISEVINGKFTFETDHFTPYIFASVDSPSTNNNNNSTNNNGSNVKTGDSAPIVGFVILAATGLVGLVYTRKKYA